MRHLETWLAAPPTPASPSAQASPPVQASPPAQEENARGCRHLSSWLAELNADANEPSEDEELVLRPRSSSYVQLPTQAARSVDVRRRSISASGLRVGLLEG